MANDRGDENLKVYDNRCDIDVFNEREFGVRKSVEKTVSVEKNEENDDNDCKELLGVEDCGCNSLDCGEAFELGRGTFCECYLISLKYNRPMMFSFDLFNDCDPRIIRTFLFFLSFGLDVTVNALFFNDDAMHKICEDRGKFNLLFQIPDVLCSNVISKLIDSLIEMLALSQDNNIIELKK